MEPLGNNDQSEQGSEDHFVKTISCDADVRFIVRLSLKDSKDLWTSKDIAMKKVILQERRSDKSLELNRSTCYS